MTTTSVATAPKIVVPHENAFMSNSPIDEPLTIAVMDCPGTAPSVLAQSDAFRQASTSFANLSAASRYDIQMRLIVAGYSDAVSTEGFTERVYDSIVRFQSDNGFAANGLLTPEELARLRQLSDPILQSWDLALVRHPDNGFTLWVPRGLGLTQSKKDNEVTFDAEGLSIAFGHFSGSNLKRDFQGELSLLRSKGLTVTYQVLKPDFFVISTGDTSLESYFRYHVGPGGVTGFHVMWKPDGTANGKRLATLMSDLFRAAAYGQLREPPTAHTA